MIFHSANNLKKKKKEKGKKGKKREKERKRKKKRKEGIKNFNKKPHAIIVTWSIPFKHGQVLFKLMLIGLVNEFG
jgi:ribosomal protein S2